MAAVGARQATAARAGYHHGDLEQALVAEALRQVRERGTEAVSLRQVAQAVGVSPSAAYAHFPDKTALMQAVGDRGMDELDARMTAVLSTYPADDAAASVQRFLETGRAYVQFAVTEPHLFRHVFGPYCEKTFDTVEEKEEHSVSYRVLCQVLDDLEGRGLLRPGVRAGLDMVAWTMVHGFASLVLDGFLPEDVGEQLVAALGRMALTGPALGLLATVVAADPSDLPG